MATIGEREYYWSDGGYVSNGKKSNWVDSLTKADRVASYHYLMRLIQYRLPDYVNIVLDTTLINYHDIHSIHIVDVGIT